MTETMTSRPRQTAPVDAVCRDAVDEARAAILELVPADHVGEHLGVVAEDDRVVTHRFVSNAPGYRGWQWAVTVARAPRARVVTVDEIAMLPGADALVAPAWVPWSQRVEPGDLGVGDVLPTDRRRSAPGPRLVGPGRPGGRLRRARPAPHGMGARDRPAPGAVARGPRRRHEPVAGRSTPGRAPRWRARRPGSCGTCGFLMPIGGPTGSAFGVCANGMSPADGRVVALTFGCGAHSEAAPDQPRS